MKFSEGIKFAAFVLLMLANFDLFSGSLSLVGCVSSILFFKHAFRIFDYLLVNESCDSRSLPLHILVVGEGADLWTLLVICNLYFLD